MAKCKYRNWTNGWATEDLQLTPGTGKKHRVQPAVVTKCGVLHPHEAKFRYAYLFIISMSLDAI
jgi:hypothetical protein